VINLAEYVWDLISLAFLLFLLSLLELEILGYGALKIQDRYTPLLALIMCIILHELFHLIPLILARHKFRIGIAKLGFLPVIYIDIKGPIPRNTYILIALSPIVFLQPILLLLAGQKFLGEVFKLTLVMNQASWAGDFILVLAALRLPPGSSIRDTGSILYVDLPKPYGRNASFLIKAVALLLLILMLLNLKIEIY